MRWNQGRATVDRLIANVEILHSTERKPLLCMLNFHRMRSFHVLAAFGAAAPRKPGMRGGLGSCSRC